MGSPWDRDLQVIVSATKIPLLHFLTLIVTLPSLHVFNMLVGSRLTLRGVVRLLDQVAWLQPRQAEL